MHTCQQSQEGRAPREKENQYQWIRPAVQIGFALASVLIGLEFRSFVNSLADPGQGPIAPRPPAAEAYLPISSLMSLAYLFKSGEVARVHPAGLVLFSLTLVLAVAIRRGFCSWVCPVGLLSEWLHKLGRRLMGRNVSIPRWLDVGLRALKYLLLAFFVVFVARMPVPALRDFIYGPYNRIADVKMYLFFAHVSITGIVVLAVLALLSVVFKNFWCRYLCPYGALVGLLSRASPVAVRRDADACIHCGKCTQACPNRIAVERRRRVATVECTACFSCVHACPAPGALGMSIGRRGRAVSAVAYGAVTVAAFVFAAQIARAAGYWHSETPPSLYRHFYLMMGGVEHPPPRPRLQGAPGGKVRRDAPHVRRRGRSGRPSRSVPTMRLSKHSGMRRH